MVPLFADLDAADLARLCRTVQEVDLPAGEVLFHEGTLADRAFVLHRGQIEVVKVVDGREVTIDTHDEAGTVIGEMALLEETTRLATVRARRDSHLLALDHEQVVSLLLSSPSAAKVILHTLTRRWRSLEAQVHHNERMAQLGTLAAGIAHELNNPVAAVVRGTQQLTELLDRSTESRLVLERADLTADQRARLGALAAEVEQVVSPPSALDALTSVDLEDELEVWLDRHGVDDAWQVAPGLVGLGLTPDRLGQLAEDFGADRLSVLARWLSATFTVRSLLVEVGHGASRVAETVQALKSYVHLDQATVQDVDVNQGLEDTLLFLRHTLLPDVRVERAYAADLPRVGSYASELNQVWTNLIDNAVDAVDGHGTIVVRTHREDAVVVVEIEDDGPGIPSADVTRVFDPFFTTKPPGQGAGLGLGTCHHIIERHRGRITVDSRPGRTVFRVELPAAP
ncbi:sensor histidine kinase [Terrabacter sp. GCM10028922]|uniref:sensor histidine kinase n=1 Tax=Terrabacter sp. GCM10028922 TaxID=3273428 RepID=UPI003614C392